MQNFDGVLFLLFYAKKSEKKQNKIAGQGKIYKN